MVLTQSHIFKLVHNQQKHYSLCVWQIGKAVFCFRYFPRDTLHGVKAIDQVHGGQVQRYPVTKGISGDHVKFQTNTNHTLPWSHMTSRGQRNTADIMHSLHVCGC